MTKVFIITGAADGIGKACVIKIAEQNPNSVFGLIDIQKEKLVALGKELELNHQVVLFDIDVTDYANINRSVLAFLKQYNRLDGLINSAGFIEPFKVENTPLEMWKTTFEVNIHAIFNLTQLCHSYLKKVHGRIVNIASTSASSPRPGWTAYAASKAALLNFSLSCSEEFEPDFIKVYCVSPGRCATELRKRQAPDEDPTTIMQPDQVGTFVADLLSEKGKHLDGQDLIIRRQIRL